MTKKKAVSGVKDYVEIDGYHNSGVSESTLTGKQYVFFTVHRLS